MSSAISKELSVFFTFNLLLKLKLNIYFLQFPSKALESILIDSFHKLYQLSCKVILD